MKVAGKTVLVSGGTSGLGLATARYLHGVGANVAILGSRDPEPIAEAIGPGVLGVQADITDERAVARAVQQVVDTFGALHANVNAAGVMVRASLLDEDDLPTDISAALRMIDINLGGTYRVISHCVAAMLRNPLQDGERGVVINTSSISAHEGTPATALYAATKAAVEALALPLAREFAGRGVRINTVVPGGFLTPMNDWMPAEFLEAVASQVPNPTRLGHPDEYAAMVLALIENSYANAAAVRIDGGQRLSRALKTS